MKEQIEKLLIDFALEAHNGKCPSSSDYASQISALFNTEEISEILKGTTVTKFKLLVNNGKPFECNGDCSNIINKGDWFGNEVFPDGNELNLCLYHSSAIMSNVNNKCFKALIPDQKQEVCPEIKRYKCN